MTENKFEWGASVKIIDMAPQKYCAIRIGSVCGIRILKTENTAEKYDEPIGSKLYLVESSDGRAIEIPERFLELA